MTDTGWRRLIGCLKLQDIFRKSATDYSALLRKVKYEDHTSNDSMSPCLILSVTQHHQTEIDTGQGTGTD